MVSIFFLVLSFGGKKKLSNIFVNAFRYGCVFSSNSIFNGYFVDIFALFSIFHACMNAVLKQNHHIIKLYTLRLIFPLFPSHAQFTKDILIACEWKWKENRKKIHCKCVNKYMNNRYRALWYHGDSKDNNSFSSVRFDSTRLKWKMCNFKEKLHSLTSVSLYVLLRKESWALG